MAVMKSKSLCLRPKIHDPLDGLADGVPRGIEAGSRFLPTQTLGPAGEKMAEDVAAGVLALRPGDGFDLDAAGATIDTPHGVGQHDGDVVDGNELEGSGLGHVVIPSRTSVCPQDSPTHARASRP